MKRDVELERLLERAQRLQALTGSSNVHEAALAAEKLQVLLFNHNLNQLDVNVAGSDDEPFVHEEVYDLGTGGHVNWKRLLINAVARSNFGRVFSRPGTNTVILIGPEHALEIITYFYEYLRETIVRLADEAFAASRPELSESIQPRSWRNSFYLGAVAAVRSRLEEQRWQEEEAADEQWGLVVATEAVVEAYWAERFGTSRRRRCSSRLRGPAVRHGCRRIDPASPSGGER